MKTIRFLIPVVAACVAGRYVLQHKKGEAEDSLREAVRMAREFDANPVYTLDNIAFAEHIHSSHVYDNGGPTAMEGLRRTMDENKDIISDAFKQKFEMLMKNEA